MNCFVAFSVTSYVQLNYTLIFQTKPMLFEQSITLMRKKNYISWNSRQSCSQNVWKCMVHSLKNTSKLQVTRELHYSKRISVRCNERSLCLNIRKFSGYGIPKNFKDNLWLQAMLLNTIALYFYNGKSFKNSL